MQSRDKSQREASVNVSTQKKVRTMVELKTFKQPTSRTDSFSDNLDIFSPSTKLILLIDLTEEWVFCEVDVTPRKMDK